MISYLLRENAMRDVHCIKILESLRLIHEFSYPWKTNDFNH